MPLYEFRNNVSGEIYDLSMKISELDKYLEDNPNIERYHGSAPSVGDSIKMGFKKPDDAFRDKLKDIKRKHRRSVINTF
jgi:hypothetical protein